MGVQHSSALLKVDFTPFPKPAVVATTLASTELPM